MNKLLLVLIFLVQISFANEINFRNTAWGMTLEEVRTVEKLSDLKYTTPNYPYNSF